MSTRRSTKYIHEGGYVADAGRVRHPRSHRRTKYVHEGGYVAEVGVDLLEDDTGWAPYLTVEDACRLDDVREALRRGDIAAASNLGRVFRLEPIAVSH